MISIWMGCGGQQAQFKQDPKFQKDRIQQLIEQEEYQTLLQDFHQAPAVPAAQQYLLDINTELLKDRIALASHLNEKASKYFSNLHYKTSALLYEVSLELNPDNTQTRQNLRLTREIAQLRDDAEKAESDGDLKAAMAAYAGILKLHPDNIESDKKLRQFTQKSKKKSKKAKKAAKLVRKAKKHLKFGDIARAIQSAKKALRYQKGNRAAAKIISDAEEQMRTTKPNQQVREFLAMAKRFEKEDQLVDARDAFEAAISVKKSQEAKRGLKRVKAKIDKRCEQLIQSGNNHYAEGRLEAALVDWNQVIELTPGNREVRENVVTASKMIRRLKEIQNKN